LAWLAQCRCKPGGDGGLPTGLLEAVWKDYCEGDFRLRSCANRAHQEVFRAGRPIWNVRMWKCRSFGLRVGSTELSSEENLQGTAFNAATPSNWGASRHLPVPRNPEDAGRQHQLDSLRAYIMVASGAADHLRAIDCRGCSTGALAALASTVYQGTPKQVYDALQWTADGSNHRFLLTLLCGNGIAWMQHPADRSGSSRRGSLHGQEVKAGEAPFPT